MQIDSYPSHTCEELERAGVPADSTADLLGNVKVNFRYEADWEHFIEGLRLAGLGQ